MAFQDRGAAGRRLANGLLRFRDEDVVVLALPRGGVPVAFEIARSLRAPLDLILVRKLGVPFQPERAFGAIGEDDVRVLDDDVVRMTHLTAEEIAAVEQHERVVLRGRVALYRGQRPRIPLRGRTALIVDDGVATGATAHAACLVARAHGASRVVLAAPVGASESLAAISKVADEVVCVEPSRWFWAVGSWYTDFPQVSDAEVMELLVQADEAATQGPLSMDVDARIRDEEVIVSAGATELAGHLTVPENCTGAVIFAHGSGSSRHSPRNRYVAGVLNGAGLATLLLDLLTPAEEKDRSHVFDIEMLADRLVAATRWLGVQPETAHLRVGYFGASTGAGAALQAASRPGLDIAAVVSRGGRPDLAGSALAHVTAPTLLIVGGHDPIVLDLNRQAAAAMTTPPLVDVVAGATHLFDEPGTLEQAADLACDWFVRHLAPVATQ